MGDVHADGTVAVVEHAQALAARHRAAFALSQLDQACYFLTVRAAQQDPEGGIAAMASQLYHFLETETAGGATA